MSPVKLELLRQEIAEKLAELAPLFQPFMRLSFVARDPANAECIVVVSDDDLRGLIDHLTRQAGKESLPAVAPAAGGGCEPNGNGHYPIKAEIMPTIKLAEILDWIGAVDVDQWPTSRAARLAYELLEECRPVRWPTSQPTTTPKSEPVTSDEE